MVLHGGRVYHNGNNFFINMTHIFHYCVFTKKLVKRKVKKDMDLELGRLAKVPSNDAVIVPGLV